jgi:NADH:ubiquinone oxidoreductase subunit 5 (subunit L)/multisubunit Na+/H+ antiporter MnhA subunit
MSNTCEKNVPLWLLVQCLLFLLNCCMALYLFSIFSQPYNQQDQKDVNFGERLNEVVCNNPIVALYILLAGFILVWQFIGSAWVNADYKPGCADEQVFKMAKIALTCMWLFIMVGCLIFMWTACVNSCQTGHCCQFAPPPTAQYHQNQQRRHHRGPIEFLFGSLWSAFFGSSNHQQQQQQQQQQQRQQQQQVNTLIRIHIKVTSRIEFHSIAHQKTKHNRIALTHLRSLIQ